MTTTGITGGAGRCSGHRGAGWRIAAGAQAQTPRRRRPHRRMPPGRRRRRSLAIPASGTCRPAMLPPRSSRSAPTTSTSTKPASRDIGNFIGDVRLRHQRSHRALRRRCASSPHRPRLPAAGFEPPTHGRRVGQRLSARCATRGPARRSATSTSAPSSTSCPSTPQKPVALAVRGIIKLPTGDDVDVGTSSGKADFTRRRDRQQGDQQEVRALRLWRLRVRGEPDDSVGTTHSNGLRWGFGFGRADAQPAAPDGRTLRREVLRRHASPATAERVRTARSPVVWPNRSPSSSPSALRGSARTASSSASASPRTSRTTAASDFGSASRTKAATHGRAGPHRLSPGRAHLRAAAAAAADAAADAAAPNRPPTVKARCEPCTSRSARARRSPPTRRIRTATR